MGKTSIEWCDYSWPIVNGCRRCSPGCEHCYAERLTATRLRQQPKYRGLAVYGEHGPRWTGETRLWEQHLLEPLRLRTPSRIFIADMGDLFYEGVPDGVILQVLDVVRRSLNGYCDVLDRLVATHTFQVLTKRAERMSDFMKRLRFDGGGRGGFGAQALPIGDVRSWPPAPDEGRGLYLADSPAAGGYRPVFRNLWLGVSVEDQQRADERIPHLLRAPAAVRFISAEPLLGRVDLTRVGGDGRTHWLNALSGRTHVAGDGIGPYEGSRVTVEVMVPAAPPRLSWVIVGGESGKGARPFDVAWARSIVAQCRGAGVPVFVKQLGAFPVVDHEVGTAKGGCARPLTLSSHKGGDPAEWPEDLRVREWPAP